MRRRQLVTFSGGVELRVASDATATASPAERTIEGIVVPFGPAGRTSGGLLTFGRGSLRISDPKRVKLLVEHNQREAVGYGLEFEERDAGLWGRFHVPEGDAGDRVLAEAANGIRDAFSVGVMLDAAVESNLRQARGSRPVKGTGDLRETSMVSVPAFDDARVGSVAANSHRLVVSGWTDATDEGTTSMFTDEQRHRLAELLARAANGQLTAEETTERAELEELATAAGVTVTAASSSSSSSSTASTGSPATAPAGGPAEAPATVRAAYGTAAMVASDPATYALDGSGPSLVRDAYRARMEGDADAAERIRRFNTELAGGNHSSLMALAAVEDTTTAPSVVPTLHRPELMRGLIDRARPLISRVTTVPLTNANPFSIPKAGEFSGVGDHTEGTAHVAEGDLLLDGDTVTPRASSGAYRISRELIDSSNPILDRLAMRKMLKDYRRHTELKAYTAWRLGITETLSIDTVAELDAELDAFINTDEETADFVALSPTLLTTLKGDVDGTGRPHLARYTPTNATGQLTGSRVGHVGQMGDAELIRVGTVDANDGLIVREAGVLWAESRVQQFSFSEVEGPGIVKLALWAYTAAARLDDADVAVVTSSAT